MRWRADVNETQIEWLVGHASPPPAVGHDSAAAMSATPATNERRLNAIRSVLHRGLSRIEAAIYIGVGVTKFDAPLRPD